MSIKDLTTILPPIVLLALILSITPELCQPSLMIQVPIIRNNQDFNPFCYIKTFNPEPPELRSPTQSPVTQLTTNNITASGTATGMTSPSPSFENPDIS